MLLSTVGAAAEAARTVYVASTAHIITISAHNSLHGAMVDRDTSAQVQRGCAAIFRVAKCQHKLALGGLARGAGRGTDVALATHAQGLRLRELWTPTMLV